MHGSSHSQNKGRDQSSATPENQEGSISGRPGKSDPDTIVSEGTVISLLTNGIFNIKLWNGHIVRGHISSHLQSLHIGRGDLVRVEMSTYDLSKGLITDVIMQKPSVLESPSILDDGRAKANSVNTDAFTVLRFRLLEEPLTARNLTAALTTTIRLHTKCWLISQQRYTDLVRYSQTYDPKLEEEAHLIIAKIRHNSPADIRMDISPQGVAEALTTAIDGIAHSRERYREAALHNAALEAEIRQKEQAAQAVIADQEQARHIAAGQAVLEQQRAELEREKAVLDIQRQQIEIQKAQLDLEVQRVNQALELAGKMVDLLQPDLDRAGRAMLIQTLLPDVLQLGAIQGLQRLALPSSAKPSTDLDK